MKYLYILLILTATCSNSAFAITDKDVSGKWCQDIPDELTGGNSNMRKEITISEDGTFREYLVIDDSEVDGADGSWSLKGDQFKVHGFWVFEENFRVPDNYVDTFKINLLNPTTLILERTKNKDLFPDAYLPENGSTPSQVYQLQRCNIGTTS